MCTNLNYFIITTCYLKKIQNLEVCSHRERYRNEAQKFTDPFWTEEWKFVLLQAQIGNSTNSLQYLQKLYIFIHFGRCLILQFIKVLSKKSLELVLLVSFPVLVDNAIFHMYISYLILSRKRNKIELISVYSVHVYISLYRDLYIVI